MLLNKLLDAFRQISQKRAGPPTGSAAQSAAVEAFAELTATQESAARANHNARRNTLCINLLASRLRGHKQHTVHTATMTISATIQPVKQSSTVCMRPPGLFSGSAIRIAGQHALEENVTGTVLPRNSQGNVGKSRELFASSYGPSCREARPFDRNAMHAIITVAKLACGAYCCRGSEDGTKRAAAERSGNLPRDWHQSVQRPEELNRDMSLDDQKAKCHRLLSCRTATRHLSMRTKAGRTCLNLQRDGLHRHPAHGVGHIRSIDEQTGAGASLEFFVIFFAKSGMTVRVPVRKAATVGMRALSILSSVQGPKQILSEAPRKVRGNWSRLAQECESKINSGDIIAIAEVARDLFLPGDSGQSFSERQLSLSAIDRPCGEIALIDGISEQQAVEELEGLSKTSRLKRGA